MNDERFDEIEVERGIRGWRVRLGFYSIVSSSNWPFLFLVVHVRWWSAVESYEHYLRCMGLSRVYRLYAIERSVMSAIWVSEWGVPACRTGTDICGINHSVAVVVVSLPHSILSMYTVYTIINKHSLSHRGNGNGYPSTHTQACEIRLFLLDIFPSEQ
jgi:hypothetical protein